MFDQIRAKRRTSQMQHISSEDKTDEYDRYLQAPVEIVEDVLRWWYEHRDLYPRLSRMALDYLTIPGKLIITISAVHGITDFII